jgi:hypothetical protein
MIEALVRVALALYDKSPSSSPSSSNNKEEEEKGGNNSSGVGGLTEVGTDRRGSGAAGAAGTASAGDAGGAGSADATTSHSFSAVLRSGGDAPWRWWEGHELAGAGRHLSVFLTNHVAAHFGHVPDKGVSSAATVKIQVAVVGFYCEGGNVGHQVVHGVRDKTYIFFHDCVDMTVCVCVFFFFF